MQHSAFPQARLVALAGCGFTSDALWRKAGGNGAELLWLAKKHRPEHITTLAEDFLAGPDPGCPPTRRPKPITCALSTTPSPTAGDNPSPIACSPQSSTVQAPDTDLAAAYVRRWEIEVAVD
jgi:hypothetical protein